MPLSLVVLAVLLLPHPAAAHIAGSASGFGAGFPHPLLGPDHLVAMVAVGLWGAQLGSPALWVLPVAFPLVMAAGGLIGISGTSVPYPEQMVALSGLGLGLMVVFRVRMAFWAAAMRLSPSLRCSTVARTAAKCLERRMRQASQSASWWLRATALAWHKHWGCGSFADGPARDPGRGRRDRGRRRVLRRHHLQGRRRKRGLCCLVALLLPAAAHAHDISPAIKGFYAGGMMVLNGPEDLLQWVALGAFAAIHPAKQAGWVAEALVMGLLAGLAAGSLGLAGSVPLWANVAVLLTVGTLLVAGACIPFAALGGLAAGIGLLHGVHAGADMATLPDKLAIAAGVGITAVVELRIDRQSA